MSDEQKIWFIYLTDHHEGPFTAAEIAEKAKAGLVSGQSLAWKDGMPEWVAAETIPELNTAMNGGDRAAGALPAGELGLSIGGASGLSPGPAVTSEEEGGVSLAQLLAQSQQGSVASEDAGIGPIANSASVLSSMVGDVHSQNPVTFGGGVSLSGMQAPTYESKGEPGIDDEVWTLKVGAQVSGLHSLRRLKELAGSGDLPADAKLWHAGWSDFQPLSAAPQVEASRKKAGPKSTVNTKTNITRPGFAVSAMSNAAADNNEEPTDTAIKMPPKGLQGILFRVHGFVESFKRQRATNAKSNTAKVGAVGKGKAAVASAGMVGKRTAAAAKGGSAMRMASLLLVLLMLMGAAGGAYYFFMMSPIPSSLDVNEEDREAMTAVVTMKADQGHKLYLAQAKGTEDDPPDPTSPKYYVATNLPEGTTVTLHVAGVPGTLVNRVAFEKAFTATVDKDHLAAFDQVKEDGKPLWGEFNLKIVAEGAEPTEVKGKFIGIKGGAYHKRLKAYKDSVQSEYDKEVAELREYIATLKNLQIEASKQIADYKAGWATPANRTKIITDWTSLTTNSQSLLSQLVTKLKERQSGEAQPKYHARAFTDISTTVGQLEQLVKAHGERLNGTTATANADEIDGLVQAGVQALEGWLSAAVSKNPFDSSRPAEEAPKGAPAPASTPPVATTAPAGAAITPPAVTK